MPTSKQVREWGAANNHDVSGRGRLAAPLVDDYNAAHSDDPYVPDQRGHSPDYPDGDFGSAFADDAGPEADVTERSPVRPPARGKAGGRRWFGGRRRAPRGKRAKDAVPRISTADLIGAVWRAAGGVMRPVPSMSRMIQVQAPVAGILLDDVVRETAADVLLQPFARAMGTSKAVGALFGPLVFTGMLEAHRVQCITGQKDPNPVVMAIGKEGLRQSLIAMFDVAGPAFADVARREHEMEEAYGQTVDEMMTWLFTPFADPDTEAARIRRLQGLDADEPAPARPAAA